MKDQLERAMNLAKKTGDRLLVYDFQKQDNAYVVMSIDEYEKIVIGKNEVRGLTEDELLDKINRDIAVWKSDQEELENKPEELEDEGENFIDEAEFLEKEDEKEDKIHEKKEESFDGKCDKEEEIDKKNSWVIPGDRKDAADEVIDEDRQYLEEVTF